jgi:serine/threonine protein kinase
MIGKKLAQYEIESRLGVGGMGEVYLARDSRLGRKFAVKVLPEAFAKDPERIGRFEREAKVLASLNHANIAALHGFEQAEETHFLVMELVEGDTLAERIARAPLPPPEALKIAQQIAEALEAAHEKGIVHRDLKPANVKITPDGRVKVLDFGLAKAMSGANASAAARSNQVTQSTPSNASFSNSPTLSLMATNAGVILGKAAYMSPEQARDENTDQRTDIFAFGCVLYEMLTGRQAFQGKTVSDILASVLAREPDFSLLPQDINPRLRQLVLRTFEKDRVEVLDASVGPHADRFPLNNHVIRFE